jgi:hypothetical protein
LKNNFTSTMSNWERTSLRFCSRAIEPTSYKEIAVKSVLRCL